MTLPPGYEGNLSSNIVCKFKKSLYGKSTSKPATTPIDLNHKFCMEGEVIVDREMYQRLIGHLLYLTHSRLDISYGVSILKCYYLKGTPGKGVLFKHSEEVNIEMFIDVDYVGSMIDQKSTSGHLTFIDGNLVTWRSKKQNVVAHSSAKVELRAFAQGVCERDFELQYICKICQQPEDSCFQIRTIS
ncbi:unnamed protein product [Spirodela intermedia]|uniref:Uncharacterized protein n=1 Tax=Spirodela intermedia TaxID=51605 RepID=A0A7I8IX64_SPIIN|nr:unnamed protein product [Spirodela intermedia]CAA6662596.1 unnamed protein product [Spirodela intermedia]